MTENNKKVCNYNKKIHFTEEANKYHIDKCVMKTMKKMSDKQKCVRYMSGVMNANNSSKSCSIKDIESICEDHKKNFSLKDAQKLCRLKNQASLQFWGEKHMSKLSSIPEQKEKQEVMPIPMSMPTEQKEVPLQKAIPVENVMPIEQQEEPKNWMEKLKEKIPQGSQAGTWLEQMRQL